MTGLILVAVFVVLAVLMYLGKMPALLALPILAFALTLVAGVPFYYEKSSPDATCWQRLWEAVSSSMALLFGTVVQQGIGRLQIAIFTIMLGGIFGQYLKLSGVGESLVRKVAELAGDRPFTLCLILTLVVSFLFTTLSGLGSVILVANIYFPVLLSLGVPPLTIACLFLMGFSLGGVFNIVNWRFYTDVLQMTPKEVIRFAVPFGILFLIVLIVFLVIEFKKARLHVPASTLIKTAIGTLLLCAAIAWMGSAELGQQAVPDWLHFGYLGLLLLLFILPLLLPGLGWIAMLSPFVPISLVLVLGWDINPAFVVGILFLLVTVPRMPETKSETGMPASISPGRGRLLIQATVEGLQNVAPAVAVMMGIGMVLVAVGQDAITASLNPLLMKILPSSGIGYILFFTLLAPLALYRGPLNLWGMGSGLMGLIQQSGLMGKASILAAFLSTGQIQGVCDPTNTHNVWIANQLKVELNAILKKSLPYMWALAFAGLLLGLYVNAMK